MPRKCIIKGRSPSPWLLTNTPGLSRARTGCRAQGNGAAIHRILPLKCSQCLKTQSSVYTQRDPAAYFMGLHAPPPPLCDIPSGCCSFTGHWTVTCSSLCMLRRVAAFCWPLRPVLLLVSFVRSRSPVVGILRMCWLLPGSFDCFCCPHTSVHRPSIACLAVFL